MAQSVDPTQPREACRFDLSQACASEWASNLFMPAFNRSRCSGELSNRSCSNDETSVTLRLDCHRCAVEEADRGVASRNHQRDVVDLGLRQEHAGERILLASDLDV